MLDIYPRPVRESDIPVIQKWLESTPDNMLDPDILSNPNLKFYCAENGNPVAFLPVQGILMLESLAVSPDATEHEVSKAIGVLMQTVRYDAERLKYREMWFLGRGPIVEYASRHGWEIMMHDTERNVTALRWKVLK